MTNSEKNELFGQIESEKWLEDKELEQKIIAELTKWFGRNVTIVSATKTNGQRLYNFSGRVEQVHAAGFLSIQSKSFGYGFTINMKEPHKIIINE